MKRAFGLKGHVFATDFKGNLLNSSAAWLTQGTKAGEKLLRDGAGTASGGSDNKPAARSGEKAMKYSKDLV